MIRVTQRQRKGEKFYVLTTCYRGVDILTLGYVADGVVFAREWADRAKAVNYGALVLNDERKMAESVWIAK